jgi:SAM-dependent methyltransferase
MLDSSSRLEVLTLPREPFLAHSQRLFEHLVENIPATPDRILELGCGPDSPFLPWISHRWPSAHVHQIDAQAEVVRAARHRNPNGLVQQMLVTDMSSIPAGSKDLVLAMSVFDQNPASTASAIAKEIHRVLRPNGTIVYLHNEELNLPATAHRFMYETHPPRCLIPSDRWSPTGEGDYCTVDREPMEKCIAQGHPPLAALQEYLLGIYPGRYGDSARPDAVGKVSVPYLRMLTPERMMQVRQATGWMRRHLGVSCTEHRTAELLSSVVHQIFAPENRFQVRLSGVFELRERYPWQDCFAERPREQYFVRGVTRFGYASTLAPEPRGDMDQSLCHPKTIGADDVLLVAYQFGMLANSLP